MASYCRDAYGVYPAFTFQHDASRPSNARRDTGRRCGASRPSNARRDTGRRCGDRSGSSKPRDEWWSCNESLTGELVSRNGRFRCSKHALWSMEELETFFKAQRAAEEKKDDGPQQGGSQQGGTKQGGTQHPSTVRDLIQRVFTVNGVTDQGLADLCHDLMAQMGFPGTYSLETGTDELAAMKDMTSNNDIWKEIYPSVGLDLPHAMKFAAIVRRIP